jgi:glycosyltransferase involved in cell wall biosynthesis
VTTVMQVLHQGGGAGSVTSTLHLSIGLASAGFHVRFVCPPESEVEELARKSGLEVHALALQPDARRINSARLGALLIRHPVALINSQSARDREALTWMGLSRRLPAPLVITRRQMPRTFPLENWLASGVARKVVAVSRSVGEALIKRGTPRTKLVVIPNGLIPDRVGNPPPPEVVDQWRARIGWDPARRTIGIVSRPKDHAVVLRALEEVTTPVLLVLAGVDPASHLAGLAAQVPDRHAAVCLPFTPDVRGLYELLELVLLPSRSEGLSQSLLEAMALGKPVIASASGGNVDAISERKDGRLVPPTDSAAWAGAIQELLADPALSAELGKAARQTARHRFDIQHTIAQTADLYRRILGTEQHSPY